MERILFERPREKLQAKGVAYLSTTELIQAVLGSGTPTVSAARLSKRVSALMTSERITMRALLAINGIGIARACQLLAAIELGKRITERQLESIPLSSEVHKIMAQQKQKVIIVYSLDGAGRMLYERLYPLSIKESTASVVRSICADLSRTKARSVILVIGSKSLPLEVTYSDYSLVASLEAALLVLQITVTFTYSANAVGVKEWKKGVMPI